MNILQYKCLLVVIYLLALTTQTSKTKNCHVGPLLLFLLSDDVLLDFVASLLCHVTSCVFHVYHLDACLQLTCHLFWICPSSHHFHFGADGPL